MTAIGKPDRRLILCQCAHSLNAHTAITQRPCESCGCTRFVSVARVRPGR